MLAPRKLLVLFVGLGLMAGCENEPPESMAAERSAGSAAMGVAGAAAVAKAPSSSAPAAVGSATTAPVSSTSAAAAPARAPAAPASTGAASASTAAAASGGAGGSSTASAAVGGSSAAAGAAGSSPMASGGAGAPALPDLTQILPPPSTPETRIPSPNNPAECPAVAPENPIGDCLGLPVYVECNYGTYTCICDWYHWLCAG